MRLGYAPILFLMAPLALGNRDTLIAQNTPRLRYDPTALLLVDEDPMTGIWNLNVAKSKFNPGPALKSSTLRTEIHYNSFKCVFDPVDARGNARHGEWTAKMDGKDYPTALTHFADAIALNRIDSDSIDAVYKRGGKAVLSERLVFSKDRKILTIIQREITPTGQGFNNTLVYYNQDRPPLEFLPFPP